MQRHRIVDRLKAAVPEKQFYCAINCCVVLWAGGGRMFVSSHTLRGSQFSGLVDGLMHRQR